MRACVRVLDTNEPASWFNWARGHPRAFLHGIRDCVRMGRNRGRWLWHETPCNALNWKYRFICQYGKYFTLSNTYWSSLVFSFCDWNTRPPSRNLSHYRLANLFKWLASRLISASRYINGWLAVKFVKWLTR